MINKLAEAVLPKRYLLNTMQLDGSHAQTVTLTSCKATGKDDLNKLQVKINKLPNDSNP